MLLERKKRVESEERLFDLLFSQNQQKLVENSSVLCQAEGKPHYRSYAHLVENKAAIRELLELVNEELQNKQTMIKKVWTCLC